jgi:hypothetical protein
MGTFLRVTAEKGSGLPQGGRSKRKLGPLKDSGTTIFDNSKAGNFMPITLGRLRSAWGSDGMIYYKFCSSMLSSTVDLQGELSQAPDYRRVDSPGAEESDHGIMELRKTGRTNRRKAAV